MTNPNTKNGITKDSTLLININPYLPTNYKQTLNYVGYWKWDSTSNTFIRGTGIDNSNYNLFIDPIWYDGENGSKKRIRITNGLVYDVNTVDTDFNGAMEVNVTQNQNNQQIQRLERALKSTTRDTNNLYNSFEVEAIPPTITTDITSNGYYKFNDNWNGLVSGTSSNYNLNVNITPKINITDMYYKGYTESINPLKPTGSISLSSFTRYSGGNSIKINVKRCLVVINFTINPNNYTIILKCNNTSSTTTYTPSVGDYYYIYPLGTNIANNMILFYDSNGKYILCLSDVSQDTYHAELSISSDIFSFSFTQSP